MRLVPASLLAALLLLALIACGVAPSPPPTVTGSVRDMFLPDGPTPGIAVAAGNARTASGADGSFTLAGVEAPYDIVAISGISSGDSGLAVLTGYHQTELVTTRLGAWPIEAGFSILSASDVSALAGPIGALSTTRHYGEVAGSGVAAVGADVKVLITDGFRYFWDTIPAAELSIDGDFTFSLWFMWPGSETRDVIIGAYQYEGGNLRFARVADPVTLTRNQTVTGVEIPELEVIAGPLDTTLVEVTVNAPGGQEFTSGGVVAVMLVDGIFMEPAPLAQAGLTPGETTETVTLEVFEVPGARYALSVLFDLEFSVDNAPAGNGFATRPYTALPAAATFDLPAAPLLDAPADLATVGLNPEFTFTPTPGASAHTLFAWCAGDPLMTPQFWIVQGRGAAGSLRFPLNPGIGATLNPDSACEWGLFATTGRTPTPDRGWLTAESLMSGGGPQLLAQLDLPYLLEEAIAVVLAPQMREFTVAD